MKTPLQQLETLVDREPTYYFTFTSVRVWLDIDDDFACEQQLERVQAEATTLEGLLKEILAWRKRKKAVYVEASGNEDEDKALFLSFDLADVTVYATVHAKTPENKDVTLNPKEVKVFLKTLEATQLVKPRKKKK